MARFLSVLLLLIVITVAAAPTPNPPPEAEYPRSMAALGDSVTRANNACCRHGDHPGHSWSTGDGRSDGNTSHYERLLQLTPAIAGNNLNDSRSGARVSDLPRQAAEAAGQRAEYVTVLIGANDLCTPTVETMTSVNDFRTYLQQALATLDQMRPRPQIFVSSIPNIHQLWRVLRDNPSAQSAWSSAGICQSMLAPSNTDGMRDQVVQRELAFNAVLADSCAMYTDCRSDGGAVYNYEFSAGDVSALDYFHPSLSGQAKLAEITWNAAWNR